MSFELGRDLQLFKLYSFFNKKLELSLFYKSYLIFSKKDRRKLIIIAMLNSFLALLDLLGIVLIGVIGALTISGISSSTPSVSIIRLTEMLQISHFQFQIKILILAISASFFLLLRTYFSFIFTRRLNHFLSKRQAIITSNVISNYMSQNLSEISKKSLAELTYQVSDGVKALCSGIIGSIILIFGDLVLLIVLSISLFVLEPITATIILGLFSFLGVAIYLKLQRTAIELSGENSRLIVESNQKLSNMFFNFKEIYVKNNVSFLTSEIAKIQFRAAHSSAELSFLPFISKFAIEALVVLGALIVSGIQFYFTDAKQAIATLTIFLAAGSRIAPAYLRIQQCLIFMKSSFGYAKPVFEMLNIYNRESKIGDSKSVNFNPSSFSASILFNGVSYKYPESVDYACRDISFSVNTGEFLGVFGHSGAGKSTVIDLMLGLLNPQSGSVLISGFAPNEAIHKWSNAISYVPQNPLFISGTLRENVCYGYPIDKFGDEEIVKILTQTELLGFFKKLSTGLDSDLGKLGEQISGGEKQRLALARALLNKPRILVLDEATNAIDATTEEKIVKMLKHLTPKVTVVFVTHRVSLLENCDKILVLESGLLVESGSYLDFVKRNAVNKKF